MLPVYLIAIFQNLFISVNDETSDNFKNYALGHLKANLNIFYQINQRYAIN